MVQSGFLGTILNGFTKIGGSDKNRLAVYLIQMGGPEKGRVLFGWLEIIHRNHKVFCLVFLKHKQHPKR